MGLGTRESLVAGWHGQCDGCHVRIAKQGGHDWACVETLGVLTLGALGGPAKDWPGRGATRSNHPGRSMNN